MRDNSCTAEIYNLGEKGASERETRYDGNFQCSMHDRLLQTRSPHQLVFYYRVRTQRNDKLRTRMKNEKTGNRKKYIVYKYLPYMVFRLLPFSCMILQKMQNEIETMQSEILACIINADGLNDRMISIPHTFCCEVYTIANLYAPPSPPLSPSPISISEQQNRWCGGAKRF